MGRNWVPKYKVKCPCGWTGMRANTGKRCPKCNFWYPKKVENKQKWLLTSRNLDGILTITSSACKAESPDSSDSGV